MTFREGLNPYSARFAERLFSHYPEWEAHATSELWANADPGAFLVEVPSPVSPERVLWVGTDGGEITVALGPEWHGHYGGWTGADEESSFAEALGDVAGILADRLIVAVGIHDGHARVSTLLPVGEEPSFELSNLERIDYVSWSGAHDRSVPL